jgi:hypothetical protein
MPGFTDALRGYAFAVHQRDGFKCRSCGLDSTQSFANWLSLSWDHLLPKGCPNRDNPDYAAAHRQELEHSWDLARASQPLPTIEGLD